MCKACSLYVRKKEKIVLIYSRITSKYTKCELHMLHGLINLKCKSQDHNENLQNGGKRWTQKLENWEFTKFSKRFCLVLSFEY